MWSLSRGEWLVCVGVFLLLPMALLLTRVRTAPTQGDRVEDVRLGAAPADEAPVSPARLDLNRATVEELTLLPGIGEHTAKAIIAYREAQGPYASIWDLSNVKGITRAKIERLEPLIAVPASSWASDGATGSAPGSPP